MSKQVLPLKAFLALLVANVKVLALQYPNARYQKLSDQQAIEAGIPLGCVGIGCYYTVGEVKDGPLTAGCIVGQAIAAMPEEYRIPLKEGKDINGNIDSAYGGYHNVRTEMDKNPDIWKMCHWANDVQTSQDSGTTWGEAVSNADKVVYR